MEIIGSELHIWYDSFEEMEEAAVAAFAHNKRRVLEALDEKVHIEYGGVAEWFGGAKDAQHAMHLMKTGWARVRETLETFGQELNADFETELKTPKELETRRRKRTRGDYGDALDLQRVWSGETDKAWERPTKEPRASHTQRYVTVYVNIASSCIERASNALWRSAIAYKISDMFAKAGYNVEIWAGFRVDRPFARNWRDDKVPKELFVGTCIKPFTQPLHSDRLAAMLTLAFFRTFGFFAICSAPYIVTVGLGRPVDEGYVKPIRERLKSGERVLRIGEVYDKASAIKEVERIFKGLAPVPYVNPLFEATELTSRSIN